MLKLFVHKSEVPVEKLHIHIDELDRDGVCEDCASNDYEDQLKIVCAICAGVFDPQYLDHNCVCDDCNHKLDKEEADLRYTHGE